VAITSPKTNAPTATTTSGIARVYTRRLRFRRRGAAVRALVSGEVG
jgi:hypothetical protein